MSKTAFYYLTGQIEGIEKAKDCLTGYFTKNGVPDKLAGDLSGLLDSLRRRLREEREDMMEDEYYDDDDDDDDDEDDDDEDSTPLTPDQALKFYDLYKQMGELQAKLEALSEEIEDGDVSETVSDAASGVEDAKFCLEDALIGPDYQYATSNEPLPGKTAEITVRDGRLLLIKIAGVAE